MRHGLATLVGVVQESVWRHAMLGAARRVLVAVSGGPDSVGLLLALATLRGKLGVELIAAHVNHRLRGAESDADQVCAAAAAAHLGIPFVHADLGAQRQRGGNLEARARALRYAALHELATAHSCERIATGHTLDDQAETVLLRLIRGSGVGGLAGIRPRRRDGVIRPLIDCRRAAVAQAVRAAGLEARFDRSNADLRFLRTHVRERVLPLLVELNPSIAAACANLAGAARAQRRIGREWAAAQLAHGAVDGALPVAWLVAQPAAVRGMLLRRWLVASGVAARGLTARHVRGVLGLCSGERGVRRVDLPGGKIVRLMKKTLRVEGGSVGRAL
ncbi:MAG: tRNA lysidine(34) synthetase TilS [bacterium]